MATNSKDIELVIRATDLSSKPLGEIADATDKLSKAVESLAPAAQRGEVSLKELQSVAGKLEKALKGLAANQAIIERFNELNTSIKTSEGELSRLAARVEEAKKQLDGAEKPTKALRDALKGAEKEFAAQERNLGKLNGQLSKLTEKASTAGIDLADLGASQARLDAAVAAAVPVYQRVSGLIDNYATNQRAAAVEAEKAAAAAKQVADAEQLAAERRAKAAKQNQELATFQEQSKSAADLVKAGEYVRWWADALDRKEAAEQADIAAMREWEAASARIDAGQRQRQSAAEKEAKAFSEQAKAAAELAKAGDYVRFWTDALTEKEAVEKRAADESKLLTEFQQLGVAAEKSAKSIKRSSTEVDALAVANSKAGAAVRQIVDPNAELVRTIGGLETVLDGALKAQATFEKQTKGTGKSVIDLRTELQQLQRAQSGAVALAGLIDRFQNTREAATGAATELRQARAEVLQYARAVQTAVAPNADLARALQEAQARLTAAEARYQTFGAAARKLHINLASAGVDMGNLAGETRRLESVASSATATANKMGAALRTMGSSGQEGYKFFNLFNTGGRTTLSLAQRLRGELLALTAQWVGLYGAMQQIQNVLGAVQQRAGTQSRLSVAFGQENVGKEMQYVRDQAERLGLELPKLADQYSQFAIAGKSAGLSLDETRFVFESFAEVGKVFQLSQEDIDGVFKALSQIFSKGKVQAEELRGQLGDRLAGSFYEFAKAMGQTSGTFDQWLQKGQVTSDFVLLFANQFRNKVAPDLNAATKTTASEIARFNTAIYDMQLAVADSGFLEAFTDNVRRLTVFFKSEDGKKFADDIGNAATKISEFFRYAIENIDLVSKGVVTLGGIWATWVSLKIIVDLISFAKNAKIAYEAYTVWSAAVITESPKMAAAITAVRTALLGIAAFTAGYSFGSWLYENSATVRKGAALVIGGLDLMWTTVKGDAQIATVELVGFWEDSFKRIYNLVVRGLRELLVLGADYAKKFGFDELAADLLGRAAQLAEKKITGLGERTKALREQLAKDIAAIKELTKDSVLSQDQPNSNTAPAAKPAATEKAAVAQTGLSPERIKELQDKAAKLAAEADDKAKKAAEKAAKERLALENKVREELAQIEDQIAQKDAKTLEERLALVEREYRKTFEDIDKLDSKGSKEGAAAKARLEELIALRKVQETQKFYDEQRKKTIADIKQAESEVNDRVQVRDAMIAAENAKRRAGLTTEEQARLNIAKITQDSNDGIKQAALDTIAMIDALKDPEAQKALASVRANMEAVAANTVKIPERLLQTDQVLDQWATGLTDVADKFAEVTNATGSLSKGFVAARDAFRQFAADFLKQIATMILKQMILNALKDNPTTAGWAEGFSKLTGVKMHTGGIVGSSGVMSVPINPGWFAGAPRYHGGGIAGLRPDEVPAILQRGEEILSRRDPRNVMNGGGASSSPIQVKVVNTIDSGDFVSQGLNTAQGQEAVLNVIRANRGVLS